MRNAGALPFRNAAWRRIALSLLLLAAFSIVLRLGALHRHIPGSPDPNTCATCVLANAPTDGPPAPAEIHILRIETTIPEEAAPSVAETHFLRLPDPRGPPAGKIV
ncbi:MAG: hypothetical protein HY286_09010 [Planctomycetes bacterium]|nr:hypothetical protein [Planctomycetota bacterium]